MELMNARVRTIQLHRSGREDLRRRDFLSMYVIQSVSQSVNFSLFFYQIQVSYTIQSIHY